MKQSQLSRKQTLLAAGTMMIVVLTALASIGLPAQRAAQAAPLRQIPIFTPTPGADGRIIYIVKANDTLLGISLITGVSIDRLRELNNMTTDTIFEGQQLLLGLAGPLEVTPTSGPAPTATPILPTPSPKPGQGILCILLFDDLNGDSIRQEDEPSIPDGAISFGDREGKTSQSVTSAAGSEHQCFENLPEGVYTVSAAVPEGYNPTTDTDAEITLQADQQFYINFGAQANSQTVAEAPTIPAQEGGRSPILGIIGALFLVAGVGVALFAGRLLRRG